jgi:hypothetical protein
MPAKPYQPKSRKPVEAFQNYRSDGVGLHAEVPGEEFWWSAQATLGQNTPASVTLKEPVRTVKLLATGGDVYVAKDAARLAAVADGDKEDRVFIQADSKAYVELPWYQDEVHFTTPAAGGATIHVIGLI